MKVLRFKEFNQCGCESACADSDYMFQIENNNNCQI